ncbi:glycosyltransferase family 2 protein [Nocardioides bruguierae]|uniref:Glycosyltransferase n=1 Tax=Nocardioides bruguierae TaxID=2945102 RepID=A0A9X2D9B3_9ACTN|nr:glycosyltransferase family 2 protein [Nocardioides bruguierae]MCM0621530.1 glycosyltransferase [Nocardioides bruguierae]
MTPLTGLLRRTPPLLSVVVTVRDDEDRLAACLDSVLGQEHGPLEVVVVDDGSTDSSADVADSYAQAHPDRVRVLRRERVGTGAARNAGVQVATGALLAFVDGSSVVPPGAYAALWKQMRRSGADVVTGSYARWEDDRLLEPARMRHTHARRACLLEQYPRVLGDSMAGNKMFKRSFYDVAGLAWPLGELAGDPAGDAPTTTLAYLQARLIGIVPEVVLHWRPADDDGAGSSPEDLEALWRAKRATLGAVEEYGSEKVSETFRGSVLAADLPRHLAEVPGCSDAWWSALQRGVVSLWGPHGSLVDAALAPEHRLVGWLVEQDRRAEAEHVATLVREHDGSLPRRVEPQGRVIDVPDLDRATVPRAAIELRPNEK